MDEDYYSDAADLFFRCRLALKYSSDDITQALHLKDSRLIRRFETDERDIHGPVWVAVSFMLRDAGELELVREIAETIFAKEGESDAAAAIDQTPGG